MTNIKFLKTLTAGAILATAFCPQAFAAKTGSCGTNCRYVYENGTLTYYGTGENGAGKIEYSNNTFGISSPIDNVIVSEGIDEILYLSGDSHTISNVGSSNGKLVLPSTLKKFGNLAGFNLRFGTIEINSKDLSVGLNTFCFDHVNSLNIIMSADANAVFDDKAFYQWSGSRYHPTSINISCKGNPNTCRAKFGNALNGMNQNNIHADYYSETDADGNVIQYHDTGYYKFDSQGNLLESWNLAGDEQYDEKGNVIAKYDADGNLRWASGADGSAYWYDANGKITGAKKTSPFTPAEAAALIKKGNVNKVTLTFK